MTPPAALSEINTNQPNGSTIFPTPTKRSSANVEAGREDRGGFLDREFK
jgi:hypothetical protein